MQFNEPGDLVHDLLGEAQLPQPFSGHPSAHDLVVMERDSTPGLVTPGPGLADVVQYSRKAQDQVGTVILQIDRLIQYGQRVLVDILVPMMLVDLEAQLRQLRQYILGQAGSRQHL